MVLKGEGQNLVSPLTKNFVDYGGVTIIFRLELEYTHIYSMSNIFYYRYLYNSDIIKININHSS